MRVFLLFALSSCALISGRLHKGNDAVDLGFYHTKAFDELAKLYKDGRPSSKKEMCADLVNIVASWCDGNLECDEKTRLNMELVFESAKDGGMDSELPTDFNENVLDSVSSMYSVLNTVTTEEDIDEIIDSLGSIEQEVHDIEDASEHEKIVAKQTLSIAKESARLWHQVYNDNNHALHGMHLEEYYDDETNRQLHDYGYDHHGNRCDSTSGSASHDHGYAYWFPCPLPLFGIPNFNITFAIFEDVTTFFTGYADAIAADPTSFIPFSEDFISTLSDVLAPSIAASALIASDADTFDD
jgi:hypothetical protein